MKTTLHPIKTWQIRLISLLMGLWMIGTSAVSQNIQEQNARQYAAEFFNTQQQSKTGLKSAVSAPDLKQKYQSPTNVKTPLSVFQKADNGFVLIAQSNNTFEVVGYSDEGDFQAQNIPPQLRALMNYYENSLQINYAKQPKLKAATVVVAPLLYEHNIRLNQFHHPEVDGGWTGCMATAFTQIMLFHAAENNKPIRGYGSNCYNHPSLGELCGNFEGITYNSAELLSYHVGLSIDMIYTSTPAGSSPMPGTDFAARFDKHFKYYVDNCIRDDFFVKNELQHRRPIYASIDGKPVGHAVVIDGYDDRNFFHLNYGWGGFFNGYFLMNTDAWYGTGNASQRFSSYYTNLFTVLPATPVADVQDSLALVAIHNSLGGYEATKWDLTKPVCKWPGVLLMNGRVIRLALQPETAALTSQSIAPEIANLSALQELSLYGCFNGTIPSTLTQLTELKKLHIANSEIYIAPTLHKGNLVANLPGDINKLSKLEWLSISNALEGTIPASIGSLSNLKLLYLYQDPTYFGKGNLTGPIPETIGNLSNLQTLHITNQQLNGSLPNAMGNLPNLWDVNLSQNQLSGTIPAMKLPNLEHLILNDNLFSEISDENWNCPKLKNLQLQKNQIAGVIPSGFGYLANLEFIDLSDNKITALPKEFGNLTQLRTFRIDNNQLKALPDGVATIINLNHLSASNNQITYIPSILGQTRLLETLDLSNNLLTNIPEELGNCPHLGQMWFNDNKITTLPASFKNLKHSSINLDNNDISSKIPIDMLLNPYGGKEVRLFNNRFVFSDLPKSNALGFGVRNQKAVALKKQIYQVQLGDTVSIDIRNISNLSDPANEYYWLTYPDFVERRGKDSDMQDLTNNAVFKMIINEQNVKNKYYCKVVNSQAPKFSFDYNGSTVTSPCIEFLNTETIEFKLASDEEVIAQKYSEEIVTSLSAIANKTITDGSVTLVPPLKIKRGEVLWEASADGISWERISETMQRADLKANIKNVSKEALVLTPKNTAYYRCGLKETDCDMLYSEKLKVKALGKVLFDEIINVKQESRSIQVDSFEVLVPIHFYDEDFRFTITKIDNPPSAPTSVIAGSAYDVTASFGNEFTVPLLIKLKNLDKAKIKDMEIDLWKAVFYDDKNQIWIPFEDSHISLKDSSLIFTSHHLTKISWFWESDLYNQGFTDDYKRNNIRVIYKEMDTDFMKFGYDKKQGNKDWHIQGHPKLIQDITEYLPKVMAEYKRLGLSVPDGEFTVYIKEMDDAGCVGLKGMIFGYLLISRSIISPNELRQVLAHEYMHYTQDYYISANPSNSFWMEAHATLSDQMVWTKEEVGMFEPEELLESGKTSKISIFNFLSNPWDYWDMSFATNNLLGNVHYNYLAGNFLHYMRSYREGEKKLEPSTLLKETSWFGSWRTYLGNFVNTHLDANLGDEYENYVKYLLTGENENFTLINKKGNPYAYVQDSKNTGIFTHPISYRFKEGDNMIKEDDMNITVPYMAAKIVLFENTNPDTLVMVNYKQNHKTFYKHRIYHVKYDVAKEQMTYIDISDSTEYSFILENQSKENMLSKFQNYSFLLLINKEHIGASALIKDFNASFKLTATPVLNIERVSLLAIYKDNAPMEHNFDNKQDYISIGSPQTEFLHKTTEFEVRMVNKSTSKQIINNSTYQIKSQYTLIIDQGFIKGMPTMKDSTIYTQTIEHDVFTGSLKVTEHENKIHKLHTYIMLVAGEDGEIEEKLGFNSYADFIEDKTKTYWLKNILDNVQPKSVKSGWEEAYGKNISVYETANTTATQQVVTKIDAKINKKEFSSTGVLTSEFNANYENTDFSNPNLKLRLILESAE